MCLLSPGNLLIHLLLLIFGMRSFDELLELFHENSKSSALRWVPMEFKLQKAYYIFHITRCLCLSLILIESIYGTIVRDLSWERILFLVIIVIYFFRNTFVSRKNCLVWLAIFGILIGIGYFYFI